MQRVVAKATKLKKSRCHTEPCRWKQQTGKTTEIESVHTVVHVLYRNFDCKHSSESEGLNNNVEHLHKRFEERAWRASHNSSIF